MKKTSLLLERLFIFSPIFVVFCSIFNFSDTKSLVSRLSVLVIIYCIFRYKDYLKSSINKKTIAFFISSSLILFIYLSIMHLWRGDNFGFPRTLITCLLYLIVIPWDKFSKKWIFNTIIIASYICGFNAMYEHLVLGMQRVGFATNPIPYAFYCAFLSLSALYLVSVYQGKLNKLLILVGSFLSLGALILTEARGVWLGYPIAMLYVLVLFFEKTPKRKLVLFIIPSAILLFFTFNAELESRIDSTSVEIHKILEGDHQTSIGARIDLWGCAINLWLESPLLGVGDEKLESAIKQIPNQLAYGQPHIHNQYLDTLSRYGSVGLVFLIVWVISGIVGEDNRDSRRLIIICSGLILISGLSDVPFHHTHTVYLFGFLVGSLKLIED
ncbi:O-antigen ligase family protein [Vibrio pectenicida]|uniref:O-antigen ligase family protein n=1 Tax=Vibrio pectenicida TaxID=62763 RepID=A0A3R9EJP4_9VIBR|nr:O-antigen ligase family protein [Vibrio pectenicida]RSD32026.1 O-antigen ligase family protein [Vibrio pectenicida]